MYGLVKALYGEQKQRAFESLYCDSDVRVQLLMRSTLAEALKDCPRIIESHGSDWLLCTLSSYHKSEDDTVRVFQAIMRKFDSISFGLLTDEIKFREISDIADTCLVGLSFFRPKIEILHKRRAAPSVNYYTRAGSLAFKKLGYDGIGDDFQGWIEFIEKELTTASFI